MSQIKLIDVPLDVDECLNETVCHDNATCQDTVGSFKCNCNEGFAGDGQDCEGKELTVFG